MKHDIEYYRRLYPAGTRIQLDADMDDPQPVLAGTKGTIISVDDMAQAVMKWDNGRSLSLILDHDRFHVISQEESETEEADMSERKKPLCPIIGSDGNIFNILGIASRTLRSCGMPEKANEMYSRVTSSGSYEEALGIITDYITPCGAEEINNYTEEEKLSQQY